MSLITVKQVESALNDVQSAYGQWLVWGPAKHDQYNAAWAAARKIIQQLVDAQVTAVVERDARACIWHETEDGEYWHGQCGKDWNLTSDPGTPSDQFLKFCPQCGRPVVIRPVSEGDQL